MVAEERIQASKKQGDTMTELHAKPIVDGVLWVVEQNGEKVGTLHKKENNKYMLCASNGEVYFSKKSEITKRFGDDFFLKGFKTTVSHIDVNECHGYPTKWAPFNSMYDVQRKLPLFTKSNQSKSLFCAGHYIIKFPKNWVRSFCPKLITIERYPFTGPFKTEEEAKEALANVK
jgi:hypothetical protein